MTISAILKKLKKNFTYKEISDLTGIPERRLYLYRNGDNIPNYETGKKLEKLLERIK